MRAPMIVAVLAAVPVVAAAQSQSSREPVVQVGIYGYQADGTIGVSAFDTADTGPELGTTVYLISQPQRCGMGAGNRKPPADTTDAWQFTGKVLSATSEEAVVQLNWRRLIVQGRAVNGDESSTQLTVRAGESVQLDQAGMESKPGCPTVAVGFEARYAPRFSGMAVGRGSGGGAGGGGGVSGRVSAGSGSGGGVRIGAAGGSGVGTGAGISGSGAGGALAVGSGMFDVNLWLVRSVPGQPDEVTHSTLRMNQDGASFAFAPIAVATSRGAAIVQVTGTLAVVRGTSGEEQLVFSTSRRVGLTSSGQAPRDSGTDSHGSSRIVNRMPGPEEVLAFEMPPITVNGQQSAPDQLSVRVKIAPRR